MPNRRPKRRMLAVVATLSAASAVACAGSAGWVGFEESTGYCYYNCGNACGVAPARCPETGAHADACCTLVDSEACPAGETGDSTGHTGDSTGETGDSTP